MKSSILTLIVIATTSFVAEATITLTGFAIGSAYSPAPTTAQLGLLLIKNSGVGGGYLNNTLTTGQNGLTTTSDPLLASSAAGLDVGSTFGGNLVAARLTSSSTFMNGANATILGTNAGAEFAIVWFSNVASTATGNAPGSASYGIASASNWTLGADGTTFGFGTSPTVSNIYARMTNVPAGDATVPAAFTGASVRFATQGTAFSVVPEPSAALLGALGALGLLRRRRN